MYYNYVWIIVLLQVYKPSLYYYNDMKFLIPHIIMRASVSTPLAPESQSLLSPGSQCSQRVNDIEHFLSSDAGLNETIHNSSTTVPSLNIDQQWS